MLFPFFSLFIALSAHAQTQKLSFPPERNRGQILPQSFDYELYDRLFLRVGDTLFDTKAFVLQLEPKTSSPTIKAQWPAGLVRSGRFLFLDPKGKEIHSTSFAPDKVVMVPVQRVAGSKNETLKVEIASQALQFRESLFEKLAQFSSVRACLRSEEGTSRSEICSPRLRVLSSRQWKIVDSPVKDPQVIVDGQPVGLKGQVNLQSEKESLSFQVRLVTGATVSILTKRQSLDLAILDVNPSSRMMTVRGRNIVLTDERIISTRLEDGWIADVPFERAQFYFRGENAVPLKQEFSFLGQPLDKFPKISYEGKEIGETYGSSLQVRFKLESPAIEKATAGLPHSVKIEGNELILQMEKLKISKQSSSEILLQSEKMHFVGKYSAFRGKRNMISFEGNSITSLTVQYFYGINTRSGVQLSASAKDLWIDFLLRWSRGLFFENPGLLLGLGYGPTWGPNLDGDNASISGPFFVLSYPMGNPEAWDYGVSARLGTGLSQARLFSHHLIHRDWKLKWGGEFRNLFSKSSTGAFLGFDFNF